MILNELFSSELNEADFLHLRDFTVKVSPHSYKQTKLRSVNPDAVDRILRNISSIKDNIMGIEPGAEFIVHDGAGTGIGFRRHGGNRITLATTYQTPPGFTKGKHPTFRVDINKGNNK